MSPAHDLPLLPAFWQALLAPPGTAVSPVMAEVVRQPGFSVYRNTCLKACVDALAAQFPSVLRLVGETWFRAAAAEHVRAQPPQDGRLLRYGQRFPAFLQGFPPAADLPYLPAVATLDWRWTEAHVAGDADPLAPDALLALDATALETLRLVPHPATRWVWDGSWPVYSLWVAAREGHEDPNPARWCGEGALFTRPQGAVRWAPLTTGACALLDACAAGQALASAVEAALAADPAMDLPTTLALLLQQGAFTALAPLHPTECPP